MRVIVEACTSSRSASALTVCGPWSDTTTSVRSCGSVTSSLTEAQRPHRDAHERAARANDCVDDRVGGLAWIFVHRTPFIRPGWQLPADVTKDHSCTVVARGRHEAPVSPHAATVAGAHERGCQPNAATEES